MALGLDFSAKNFIIYEISPNFSKTAIILFSFGRCNLIWVKLWLKNKFVIKYNHVDWPFDMCEFSNFIVLNSVLTRHNKYIALVIYTHYIALVRVYGK